MNLSVIGLFVRRLFRDRTIWVLPVTAFAVASALTLAVAAAFVAFAPSFAACFCSAEAFFSALARSRRRRASSSARAFWYLEKPML